MITVETTGKVRRDFHIHGKGIRTISRERGLSRNTVRRIIRDQETEPVYRRARQPRPKLGAFQDRLDEMLAAGEGKARREGLTLMRLFELLQAEGYEGGYDAVRRYARCWREERSVSGGQAFVPLLFDPGEAYQFDWSHEVVVLGGVSTTVKVAHVRLCHSRMPFVCAFLREAQEMVFEAHALAFALFGGACQRGIYDNMKTVVDAIFVGKDRVFNRRFLAMCSHYLVEPTACTPASGWEKGQVENQVRMVREQLFTPRLKFDDLAALNEWLVAQCIERASASTHSFASLSGKSESE